MERENGSFDMGGCKFDVVNFSEGENEQTFAYRGDSPHIPRVSPKSLMEGGTVHMWWGTAKQDNPTVDCFY